MVKTKTMCFLKGEGKILGQHGRPGTKSWKIVSVVALF